LTVAPVDQARIRRADCNRFKNLINNPGTISEATKQKFLSRNAGNKVDARNLARSIAKKPRLDEIE